MTTRIFDAIHHIPHRRCTALPPAACPLAAAVRRRHRQYGSRFRAVLALAAGEIRDPQRHGAPDVLFAGWTHLLLDVPVPDQDPRHRTPSECRLRALAAVRGPG